MPDLPTSVAGPTLGDISLTAPQSLTSYDTTPALQALNLAVQRGMITVDEIKERFMKGREDALRLKLLDEESKNSDNRKELDPLLQQLKLADTKSKLEILPDEIAARKSGLGLSKAQADAALGNVLPAARLEGSKIKSESDKLDAEGELLPGQIDLAKAELARKKSLVTAEDILAHTDAAAKVSKANFIAAAVKADPTGARGYAQLAQGWPVDTLGSFPVSKDGTPDFARAAQAVDVLAAYKRNALNSEATKGVYADVVKEALKRNVLLVDEKGNPKTLAQLNADVIRSSEPLSEDDRAQLSQQLQAAASAGEYLGSIYSALDSIKGLVGRKFGEGEPATKFVNELRAKFGDTSANEKLQAQDKITRGLAEQVQAAIKALAGSGNRVMKAEIETKDGLFYRTMPNLSSDESAWKDWLAAHVDKFKLALEEAVSRAPGDEQARFKGYLDQFDTLQKELKGKSKASTLTPEQQKVLDAAPLVDSRDQVSPGQLYRLKSAPNKVLRRGA